MKERTEPVRLVIDGREARVERGTTVLDAAREVGVRIPTLCKVDGIPSSSSCFVCGVQVEGRRTLSPACSLPAEDGMVVTTDSDDVVASRRMALELLLSDHAGDCVAPCAVSCPAGLDIPGFLRDIAAGELEDSRATVTDALALPGALGRICPRFCEGSCRRCDHDEGLAIGALHRWVARDDDEGSRSPVGSELPIGTPGPSSGRSVAIVGAGPAGLSAALHLRLAGHACTVIDAHEEPGGMLRWAVPAYRLPREPLRREIDRILALGVELRLGQRWGRHFTLGDLRKGHDAIFLAIGAQGVRSLDCPGGKLALSGLEFLVRVADGERPDIGRRVVVVGGGNTAMDVARTARRLGAEVRLIYRRSRDEMPCLLEEVEAAEEEGVEIEVLAAPLTLVPAGRGLEAVVRRMELGAPDASGRRRPIPVPGSERSIRCDSLISAIGQTVDLGLARHEGIEVTAWGIAANPRTLETSSPGVFAGGDAVLGPDLAVRAVAAGRRAARAIDQYLRGRPVVGPDEPVEVALRRPAAEELAEILRDIERTPRIPADRRPVEERVADFDEVEGALDPGRALREARRCLTCGCRASVGCGLRRLATELGADPNRFLGKRRQFERDESHPEIVYEPGKCIQCEVCVRIAEEAEEELGIAIVGRGFDVRMGVPFDRPLSEGLRRVAARCAEACPTGALALRTARACDLAGCGGALDAPASPLPVLRS